MQHNSTLLNSTFLGAGLRGQTNATCCAVQTRIPQIRDLGPIMISNLRRNLLHVALAWEMTCCSYASATMLKYTAKRLQLCCSHMKTKEMKCLMEIKLRSTSYNIIQHDGQTGSTCCIQQCWTMLNRDVAFLWPGALRSTFATFLNATF